MSICPACKTEHPEGEAHCPARSSAERLGAAATIYDSDASEPADPLIGKKLGIWMVVRKIGEGGMGMVYLAKDPLSGAQVAVKVLRLDEVNRIPEATFRQRCLDEAKERFRREAEVARRLGENQPHIVQILGYGTLDDGRPYFVMEFLYGRSLDARMRQEVPPSRDDLRRWFEQACDALWVIHDAGVVHRDLKPDNIWICEPKTGKSSAKLLDFGISKVKGGTSLTNPGMIPGTALYLAPERLSGSSDDPRSDIYAMGVILHEVLSGRPPFDAETIQGLYKMILMDPPPPLRAKQGLAFSPRMERLILDCLAKDPAQRPQTALDLKARLLAAFDEEGPAAAASTHAPPPQPPQPSVQLPGPETQAALAGMASARRGRLLFLAGGLGVLVAGAVALATLSKRAEPPAPEGPAPKATPTPIALGAPPTIPAPAPAMPDAGSNMATRRAVSRSRPSDRPVVGSAPAARQPEALAPPSAPVLAAPAPSRSKPALPSRPEPIPTASPAPETEAMQRRPREVLPSKSAKPSKADLDLITNEQILLGN